MAEVMVAIAPTDDAGFSAVVEQLRAAGMTVTQTLPETGVVTGTAPDSLVGDLSRLDGVASVEQVRQFDVGPPDSPVQ